MANITATTPGIDLFTRLYTSLRSKALASEANIPTNVLGSEGSAVRDFQFFLASPEFENWSSLAKEVYPTLRPNIEHDTNLSRQMASNPAIAAPTDINARLDREYITTMYVDIDNGSADNSYNSLPANDAEFGAYLKEASIPQSFDLGNFMGAMFGANPDNIPIIPVMAPRAPDIKIALSNSETPDFALPPAVGDTSLEGFENGFFNDGAALNVQPNEDLSASLLGLAQQRAATLELQFPDNAKPTPNNGLNLGSILVPPANAAEINPVVPPVIQLAAIPLIDELTATPPVIPAEPPVMQLAAIPLIDELTGTPPAFDPPVADEISTITPTQAALFWNYQTDIKNDIDPRAFTDPTFFDPNHEMLSYIQADDRYMSYVDAYLATTDLTEAEKQASRAEALADHETSIDFLNKVDAEGAFSTAVSASSDNLYDIVERTAPASETQVADLQGNLPRVDIAYAETQLGVPANLPANADIDVSVAPMVPDIAPADTSGEYYAQMQAQKDAEAAAEAQRISEDRRRAEEARQEAEAAAEQQRFAAQQELQAIETKLALIGAGEIEGTATGTISDPYDLAENVMPLAMLDVKPGDNLTTIARSQLQELGIERPSREEIRTAMNNIALLNEDRLNPDPAAANLIYVTDQDHPPLIVPTSLEGLTQDINILDFGALDQNMQNVRNGTAPLGDPNQQNSEGFQRECAGQITDPACMHIDFVNGAAGITTLQDLGFITGTPSAPVLADNDDKVVADNRATGTYGYSAPTI